MPGEVIDRPNPQALESLIPNQVLELAVKLDKIQISNADLKGLEEFRRASNYIAAGKPYSSFSTYTLCFRRLSNFELFSSSPS
jgi:xylulose-5-phosphate/fructose-6-phosphate phosphoketolase